MIVCPECRGERKIRTFGVVCIPGFGASDPSGHIWCPLCDATGSISESRMRLFKLGQNIREYRERTLSLGLREAAEKWGTTPSKLTAIESGLAESEWRPPGFPKHLEIQPPVKEGWVVNGCDDRRLLHDDEQFRKRALEALYIAIDPGGGRMMSQLERNEMFRLIGLVDELSFSLVGGVPTAHERFT